MGKKQEISKPLTSILWKIGRTAQWIRDASSRVRMRGTPGGVTDKQKQQQKANADTPSERDSLVQLLIERQKQTDQNGSSQSEDHCAQKADPPAQIQEMTAVIPPADAPSVFQKDAGQVFEHCADSHGEQKYGQRSFSYAVKQHTEEKATDSVDGKVGPFKYAPVDEGVLRK